MSIVRVGATKKYSDNWNNIFAGKKSSGATATKSAAKKAAVKAKAGKQAKKKMAKK